MSTGLLLFLVFMALSIIDSVARARRGQQKQQVLPPEDEGDEEWRAEPSSAQAEGKRSGKESAQGGLEDLVGLERLMGPGYLEKLMGPAFAGVMDEGEDDVPEGRQPSASAAPGPEAEPASSRGRGEGRRVAREGLSPDQERRRAEARRRSPVDRAREAGRRRSMAPEADSRPARRPGEAAALPASSAGRRPRRESAPLADSAAHSARSARTEDRSTGRNRLFRELFGSGDRDSLRRAFVLKEILDAPAAERPPDRREAH